MLDIDLAEFAQHVFNSPANAGDEAGRLTYYNHELKEGHAGLVMRYSVTMPTHHRANSNRLLIQVPDKLRDNLRTLYGVDDEEDYKLGTSIVALADWACGVLIEEQKTLLITRAK